MDIASLQEFCLAILWTQANRPSVVTSVLRDIAHRRLRDNDLLHVPHDDTDSITKALFGGNIISAIDYLCHTVERVKLSGRYWGGLL